MSFSIILKKLLRIWNPNKWIKIYNNLFSSNEKEQNIFNKSLNLLDKKHTDIQHYLYYFQILIEFLNKYKNNIWIDEKSIFYLDNWFEELNISFRFLNIWYYNSSAIHLRLFIENTINFIYNYSCWIWNIKFNNDLNLKDRLYKSIVCRENKIEDQYYFNKQWFYNLYKYFSIKYIHKWILEDIEFSKDKYELWILYIELLLILIPKIIEISIWDKIEENWHWEINIIIDESPIYYTYLSHLFNQWNHLFNIICCENGKYKKIILEDIGLKLEDWFSEEYINNHKEFL